MQQQVAVFRNTHQVYYADTCEALKQAAEQGELTLVARGRGSYPGPPLLSPKTLPEVRSIGYWDADHPQAWGLDWHRNEGIEFTYLARGKVHMSVDEQEFVLKPGTLTITRPWQRHRVGNPHIGASRLYWLIIDVSVRRPNHQWKWPKWLSSTEQDLAQLTTLLSHNEHPVWSANEEIESYFVQLIDAAAAAHESRVKHSISGLLIGVTDLLQMQKLPLDASLSSARRAVELFLATLPEAVHRPWDLTSMAAACGLGRSRFTTYCKQITNMSPIEYLLYCRIEVASQLLVTQKQRPITDVAFTCGFESSQYFTRVFHGLKGSSPREFRRQSVLKYAD